MDSRAEIRDLLTTRRADRGLRREDVALLAGVSVDYYTRLERGNLGGVSDSVLSALARALQLDEADRAQLFDLARAANTVRPRRRPGVQVRPAVQRILDAMVTAPAYVRNDRLDILAANQVGRAVFGPLFEASARTPNIARFMFLDRAAPGFYVDWHRLAGDTVALLRAEAGRDPYDRALSALIGELSTRSELFRTWWAAHTAQPSRSGVLRLRHPEVGALTLAYESLDLAADAGLRLNAYSAEPGSTSAESLSLLASWTAAPHERSDR